MKCPKCGAEVKEGLAACSVCFAPLTGEEAERVAQRAKEAPQPTPRARPAMQTAPRGSGGKAAAVILVLILLAAVGAGGWYYFIYMRSPQYAAKQFLEALKARDHERVYQTCVWTGLLAAVRNAQDVERMFGIAKQMGADIGIESYEIKGVEVQGNSATVKTSIVRGGKSGDWDLTMVKDSEGRWKCDLWSSVLSALKGSLRLPSSLPGLGIGR